MKTNPDDSINAFHGDTYQSADGYITSNYFNAGLSKREYFAAMAMQGYLANSFNHEMIQPVSTATHAQIAELSVGAADALIEELNK